MIIDTHCHLASKQFKGDLEEVIKKAESNKISKLISIGTDLEDSKECIRISSVVPFARFDKSILRYDTILIKLYQNAFYLKTYQITKKILLI